METVWKNSGHRPCWTREQYYRMAFEGILSPDRKTELIDGEIIEQMSPMLTPHAVALGKTGKILREILESNYHVRVQLPFVIGPRSEPEPDLAVVTGDEDDYLVAHPSVAVLLVEVSDSTLAKDRVVKASLYASANVPEYWIVNLEQRSLEVHRQPAPMAGELLGHGYRTLLRLPETETVSPLAFPDARIAVASLFPRLVPETKREANSDIPSESVSP